MECLEHTYEYMVITCYNPCFVSTKPTMSLWRSRDALWPIPPTTKDDLAHRLQPDTFNMLSRLFHPKNQAMFVFCLLQFGSRFVDPTIGSSMFVAQKVLVNNLALE